MKHLVFKNVANKAIQQQFQNIANGKLIRNSLEIWNYIHNVALGYSPANTEILYAKPNQLSSRQSLGYARIFSFTNDDKELIVPLKKKQILLNPTVINGIIHCDSALEQTTQLITLTNVILHESTHIEDAISAQRRVNSNSLRLATSFISSFANTNSGSYYHNNYSAIFIEASANIGENAKMYSILKNFVLPFIQDNPELNSLILNQMQTCKFQVRKNALRSLQNTLITSDSNSQLKDVNDSILTDFLVSKYPNLVNTFPVLKFGYHENGKPIELKDLAFQKSIHYFDKTSRFVDIYNTLIFQRTAKSLIDNPKEILSLSLSDRNLVRESLKEYDLSFQRLGSKYLYLLDRDQREQLQDSSADNTKFALENNFVDASLKSNVEESISNIKEIRDAFDVKIGVAVYGTNA